MSVADRLKALLQQKSVENLKAGQEFLAENAQRPEVTQLESGLQYEVLVMGEGEKPRVDQTVTCHYHGTVIDGRVFDSSVRRGQPASFPLNRVIAGWTEALQRARRGAVSRGSSPRGIRRSARRVGPWAPRARAGRGRWRDRAYSETPGASGDRASRCSWPRGCGSPRR